MTAPSVLIVMESPDSISRILEIGATGRPVPMRGFTRPVATRWTSSCAAELVEQPPVALLRGVLVVRLVAAAPHGVSTSAASESATKRGAAGSCRPVGLARASWPP